MQKLFKEQGVQNVASVVFDARLPFGPADFLAADDAEEEFSRPAPAVEPEPPAPVDWDPPSASPAPRLPAEEIAALRGVLAEIHESRRILGQARQQPA